MLSITALPGHHLAHLAAWTQKGVRIIYLISFIWYFWIINVSICMMVDCKAHLVALTVEVGLVGIVLAMVAAPVVAAVALLAAVAALWALQAGFKALLQGCT